MRTNKTGYKGVRERCGRFYAVIDRNGKTLSLGRFTTAKEAGDAYEKALEDFRKKNMQKPITHAFNFNRKNSMFELFEDICHRIYCYIK